MEINIKDYLSEEEIKEILEEEFKNQIRKKLSSDKETERILGNLAYHLVQQEIEKITPKHATYLEDKVKQILKEKSSLSYLIFKTHYLDNSPESFATKLIEQTVKENSELIKQKTIDSIKDHNFSKEIAQSLEKTTEDLAGNIYKISELLTSKNE